jgi:tetratricopeptide (TPR) repeat protein
MPEECREFTRDGKPFRYDLYRIPFNDGHGGTPEPLEGASNNDQSNYFARYSPNGKWIVFCKAANYMLLQPDSQLYIIPATGGPARRLRANTSRMNSWHSWSPNSRWLVFSSKANSPYTQLCLTHIDEEGESSPPVFLTQLTAPDRAANIPEFVSLPARGIVQIDQHFLNDYSFERAGNEYYRGGDPERAMAKYREALELNPENAGAHQRLGFLLYNVKHQFDEGLAHTREALRLDPNNAFAHSDLAMALFNNRRPDLAIEHWQAALEKLPLSTEQQYKPEAIRACLGQACLQLGRYQDAANHLSESVRVSPTNPETQYLLALALALQGQTKQAERHYAAALALKPQIDSSVALHEALASSYAKAGRLDEAIRSAQRALDLAQAAGKSDLAQRIAARMRQYHAAASPVP